MALRVWRFRTRVSALGLTLVALSIAALAVAAMPERVLAATHVEEYEETLALLPGETLRIEGVNGTVTVETWEGDDVVIRAVKSSRGITAGLAKALSGRVDVRIARGAGGVEAVAEGSGFPFFGFVSVGFHVRLPSGWEGRAELRTSNGRVAVSGFGGEAEVATSNGGIEVRGFTGSLRVRTSNGPVDIAESTGVLSVRTTNGPVRVRETTLRGEGALRTSNQGIVLEGALEPGASYELDTSNGRVELGLLDPDVHVDLATSNGIVVVRGEAENVKPERGRLVGTIGRGSAHLTARTSNGDILLVVKHELNETN